MKIIISFLALLFAVGHVVYPEIVIDSVTITLIAIAFLPWLLPLVKELELPGVIKITLSDVKATTKKVTNAVVKVPTISVKASVGTPTVRISSQDPFHALSRIANEDPNLALVGFRIEIEKKIGEIAASYGISTDRTPLSRLVSELQSREILSIDAASGLIELIALGNRAAHGAQVTSDAADWVLDVGPSILMKLEDVRKTLTSDNS